MSHSLFHQTLSLLKSKNINNKKILVAVSGGLDSICLLNVLHEASSIQKLDIFASYIHHGKDQSESINIYREKARKKVFDACKNLSIPFILSDNPLEELKSEQDFRDFRYQQLEKIRKEKKLDFISLAHHSEDLLESRILFMIRGCGLEGLKSMQVLKDSLLRPFLQIPRQKILDYAKVKQLTWLEDPSNLDDKFLRNWLRNHWLVEIEKKQAGSKFRLAESLNNIALSYDQADPSLLKCLTEQGIRRDLLRQMPLACQQQVLAIYMKKKNINNYGQAHIKELLKHLDRPKKDIVLKLLKKNWKISNKFISCE